MENRGRYLIASLLRRGHKPEFYTMLTEEMFDNEVDRKVIKALKSGYRFSSEKIGEFRKVAGLGFAETVGLLTFKNEVESWITEEDVLSFVNEYKEFKVKELVNSGQINEAFKYMKENNPGQTNVIEDYRRHLKETNKGADEGLLGLPTGLPSLDRITSGFRPGKVWIVGGYNAYGKSYFMTNMVNRLLGINRRACVVSLEMTKEDILDRLIGERLGIGVYELAKTVNKKEVENQVGKIEKNIESLDLSMIDSVYDILDIETKLRIENRNRKIDVIFIDFIQLIQNKEGRSQYESISEVSTRLQGLAKELGVCMVILSQISNEAQRDDTYSTYGFKGAGEIGQIADIAIRIQREKDMETNRFTDGYDLIVLKNRYGETGGIACKITFPGGSISELS